MFLLHKPTEQEISAFIAVQQPGRLSYEPPGMTKNSPAPGYNIDHNRVQLGSGEKTFNIAIAALRRWQMFDLQWLKLCWPDTPIEVGSVVAIVVSYLGCWSLNACRIVYVVETHDEIERYGFAYGTLQEHAERGEERFMVEWDKRDDSVWYDIFAISKPGPLARLGYPFARRLQKRFAEDSKEAMKRASRESGD